jgi:hypothetical protein
MDLKVTNITKLEAAERQLRRAIRLFFERGDVLAVHTVTAAAFQLFADVGKLSGVISRFRSKELIRPEEMKKWSAALNATQNFLKHADRDADAVHPYVEEGTTLLLYETVELAERVAPTKSPERLAFQLWFVFSYPEMVDPAILARLRAANPDNIDQTDRDLWAEYVRRAR